MDVKDFQKLCADTVSFVDAKRKIKRTDSLAIAQFAEEFGELVHVLNLRSVKNIEPEKQVLNDEFADVLFMLSKLAEMFDVDFQEAVRYKIDVFKERGYR